MKRQQIIEGLMFTIDMCLYDPSTGEALEEPRNEGDKITVDACREAIKALEQPKIIHCKECKFYGIKSKMCTKRWDCTEADDFCSWGEREE